MKPIFGGIGAPNVGALPGNIIQGIRKAGSRNPVLMLDEVDKLNASFQATRPPALLEVLDPAQNATFQDHYIALPFDLTRCCSYATANVLDTIPGPCAIAWKSWNCRRYIEEDKLAIAKGYLVPRQTAENGLKSENISFTDEGDSRNYPVLHARGRGSATRARAGSRFAGAWQRASPMGPMKHSRSQRTLSRPTGPAKVLQRDRSAHQFAGCSHGLGPGHSLAATYYLSKRQRWRATVG